MAVPHKRLPERRGEPEQAPRGTRPGTMPTGRAQLLLSLQRQAGNSAVSGLAVIQRKLKDKPLQAYVKQLQGKTGLPIANLVKLIKEKLTAKGDAVTEEHVTQILNGLGVTVPKNIADLVAGASTAITLTAFQGRFHHATGSGVDGYATASTKVSAAQRDELPTLIAALTTATMFAQHDGSLVRYDKQNASTTTTNLQIQLGGKDLYIKKTGPKDKSSVSAVIVDDSIIKICEQSPAIAAYVLGEMQTAHTGSLADGNKRLLTLDAEG